MSHATGDVAPHEVTIVSANAEPLVGLQTYRSGGGVAARCARDLAACSTLMSARTLAVILFPDAYRSDRVVAVLSRLAAEPPERLSVIVTAHPRRFDERTSLPEILIVPRPLWGWRLLDAIRAHAARRESAAKERRRAR